AGNAFEEWHRKGGQISPDCLDKGFECFYSQSLLWRRGSAYDTKSCRSLDVTAVKKDLQNEDRRFKRGPTHMAGLRSVTLWVLCQLAGSRRPRAARAGGGFKTRILAGGADTRAFKGMWGAVGGLPSGGPTPPGGARGD